MYSNIIWIFATSLLIAISCKNIPAEDKEEEWPMPEASNPSFHQRFLSADSPQPLSNVYVEGGANVYFGIPYAKPPVGDLAFQLPQPLSMEEFKKLLDKRDKNKFGNFCPQDRKDVKEQLEKYGLTMSLDCLTLNIFTPLKTSEPLPVYVALHPGALLYASAAYYGVRGIMENFISQDIVVVTVNYRLGAYGFYKFPGDEPGHSARGLYDQWLALQWVQEHIHRFGGDSNNVTLCGFSGGACSAAMLTLANLADKPFPSTASSPPKESSPLFRNLILQSGSADVCRRGGVTIQNYTKQIANEICPNEESEKLRECFASKPSEIILAAQGKYADFQFEISLPDGPFKQPDDMAKIAAQSKLNVLIGTVRDEFVSFDRLLTKDAGSGTGNFDQTMMLNIINNYIIPGVAQDQQIKLISIGMDLAGHYLKHKEDKNATYWEIMELLKDGVFVNNAVSEAERMASSGHEVYMYKFLHPAPIYQNVSTRPDIKIVVPHGADSDYMHMNEYRWVPYSYRANQEEVDKEKAVAKVLLKEIVSFIKTGKLATPVKSVEKDGKISHFLKFTESVTMSEDNEEYIDTGARKIWKNLADAMKTLEYDP